MLNPQGNWTIRDSESQFLQTVAFEPDGEAWAVRHERRDGQSAFEGVCFIHKSFLCLARGLVSQPADLGKKVGLVKYDLSKLGELPARWYHCSAVFMVG